jgi:PAS domain S-box-containing protein
MQEFSRMTPENLTPFSSIVAAPRRSVPVVDESPSTGDYRLNAVMERVREGVIIATEAGDVIYWNPSARAMHGYATASDGIAPLSDFPETFDLIDPASGKVLPLEEWPMRRILAGKGVHNLELRVHRKDQGWERYFSYSGDLVETKEGERLLLLFVYDLTKRKQAEQPLQESEAQLRILADSIPILAWWANADGYLTWYNRRWYEYTGKTPEQMEGWGWQSVHDPKMLPQVVERWKASIESGKPFEMDFPLLGADGQYRWFLTRVIPFRDPAGKIVRWFGTNTDVTEHKESQVGLERLVSERTAKLQEIVNELQAFSYSVSHDLRSPLRAMQGYADILLEESAGKLPPEHLHYLERIRSSATRLDRLTQELLNYSRLTGGEVKVERVSLDQLVRDIIEHYPNLRAASANIHIQGPLLGVMGNEPFLTQAISNLLANAIKFVEPGTQPNIVVKTEALNQCVRFSVEDNGIGIDLEHRARIFQIFGRVHAESEYEGTGIGLAIVKRSIERLNGSVGFESTPRKGSKFWFDLKAA